MLDADLFLKAQDGVIDTVRKELTAGRKLSHWMWFVFPQLAALGRSPMAKRFGLRDLAEAAEYLDHPTLRARLIEMAGLLLLHPDKSAVEIMGQIDALKLRSSMTLFAAVPSAPGVFASVLDNFYGGGRCPLTSEQIRL